MSCNIRQPLIQRKPFPSYVGAVAAINRYHPLVVYVHASRAKEGIEHMGVHVCEGIEAHVVKVGTGRLRRTEEVNPEETIVHGALVVLEGVHLLGEG